MDVSALTDLIYVLTFCFGGLALALIPVLLSHLIAPRHVRAIRDKSLQVIECGMDPIGPTSIRYGVVYYLYSLIFVAFSVDVLFLFPVATIYNEQPGWLDLGEILLFIGILALIIIYAWKKGVFLWERKQIFPKD
ncbi:MAG: NADH-quinone oxidoreductase subunit A [Geobacteraceae bacterium]|nr:NADH-quinone oxidoreductase subunit A [Geobacteraceae bacterium]